MQKSLLQMAIQGKLVEQRPEEGTANTLLKNCYINAEVDGRRVKQKNITEITDDDMAFEIPESWEWIKLGTVCTIARGGSPRPIKDFITTAEDGVNWIKIGDTEKDGKYIYSTAEKIKPSGVSKSRLVHAGDFLLTNSMSFGRPYILKVDGCIHDGWLVISQAKEVFDQNYLYWMLSSGYAYSQFCGKVSGGVVKNLNSDKVANSVFPLPPLAEQKRIVAKLEELLPLCERLK
jgi:type I restriction enzyme S subunit